MKEPAQPPIKEATRFHSTQLAGSRRRTSRDAVRRSGSFESEEGCELSGNAKQSDRRGHSSWSAGIASQARLPGQAIMGTLAPWKRPGRARRRSLRQAQLHPLSAQELSTSPSVGASGPIAPEPRLWTQLERVEQDAHLAWLAGLFALPLTLLAQLTGPTIGNSGREDDAQTASWFFAPFARQEPLVCRTAHRAIRLEGKGLSRKAPSLPSSAEHRWGIALRRLTLVDRWSKLGDAHRGRDELMPQFQAQIPEPLRDDLPALLTARRMRAPAVRIKFRVFVGKLRLKGPTMQI